MTDIKQPTRTGLAYLRQLSCEAGLHRALASVTTGSVAEAHLALASAIDEKAAASQEHQVAPRAKSVRERPPGEHQWGPLVPTTPAELRGLTVRRKARLAVGCQRCKCGIARSADKPHQYKVPGKPWVQVRPACTHQK